jgi:hypothetical protein
MATTTFPADEPEKRGRGRPTNAEREAARAKGQQERPRSEEEQKEREELLTTPDPNDPYRPISPPQPMPMSEETLRTRERPMLSPLVHADLENPHADRRAKDRVRPNVSFQAPEAQEVTGEDEPDEAIDAIYDPRNPVMNATWTDEEGGQTLPQRRELRAKSRSGAVFPVAAVPVPFGTPGSRGKDDKRPTDKL